MEDLNSGEQFSIHSTIFVSHIPSFSSFEPLTFSYKIICEIAELK